MKDEKYMEREMNFFDLCVAAWHALGRLCAQCGRVLSRMIRLSFRYWWIVCTLVVLALAGGLYYTRTENLTYRANAVVLLNGPTVRQFEEAFAPLCATQTLPDEAPITPYIREQKATWFATYRVIDVLHDSYADYVDFKRSVKPSDTVNVRMQDRVCVQFRVKQKDMSCIPEVERALLATLNADPVLQEAYATYLPNLREQAAFNHRQAIKLDSLTSNYYYYTASAAQPMNYPGNGVNFYGDRKIRLFLNDIYSQHERTQLIDHRLRFATDPVSLESHFALDPAPVMSRMKCLVIMLLLGWVFGCLLAEIIDQRKKIAEWLKKDEK